MSSDRGSGTGGRGRGRRSRGGGQNTNSVPQTNGTDHRSEQPSLVPVSSPTTSAEASSNLTPTASVPKMTSKATKAMGTSLRR